MPEKIKTITVDRMTSLGRLTIGWTADANWLVVCVDGKYRGARAGYRRLPAPQQVGKMLVCGAAATDDTAHFALSADDCAALDAAQIVIRQNHNSTMPGMLEQRRELMRQIDYARSADADIAKARWEDENNVSPWVTDSCGRIAEAQKNLAIFDINNPQVLGAWNDAPERARAAMEADQIAYRGE